MMPAAKHFDPVLGIDIHIIQPPGPVPPVPIPHPFVGFLIDPFDYVPILGGTIQVNGMMRAIAGTAGKNVPSHIPIGGTFVKPPANECEMFMGSTTVSFDGDAASFLALPALSCQCIGMPTPPRVNPKKKSKVKSMVLPTSVVLPIPAGPPVLIGGPPTISLMALGMKIGMAALGKAFKKLRRLQKASKRWQAISQKMRRAANALLDKIPGGDRIRNAVSKGICTLTGHPVDVATGKVLTDAVDFELPGPLPLRFERTWYSTSTYEGPLGHGWHHSYDLALTVYPEGIIARLADGRSAPFAHPEPDRPSWNPREKLRLLATTKGYSLEDPKGLKYVFTSGTSGDLPLARVEDPNGNRINLVRSGGQLSAIIDSAGRRLSITCDIAGRITQVVGPDPDHPDKPCVMASYRYDGHGDLVEASDALGQASRYAYKGHLLTRETDRNGISFFFQYEGCDVDARCIRTWGDGEIYSRELSYDPAAGSTTVIDSYGARTVYYWNDIGLVTRRIDPLGGETLVEWDEDANKLSETNACGEATCYEYDDLGRLVAILDPLSHRFSLLYDESGNCVSLTDADGNTWLRRFDERHNLRSVTDPEGSRWDYEVDGRGLLIAATDPLGHRVIAEWDARGDLRRIVNRVGTETRLDYDALGRLVSRRDAAGNELSLTWDRRARLLQQRDEAGRVWGYRYDAEGNLVEAIDPLGRRLGYSYGPRGALVSTKEPSGATTRYRHDKEGRLVAVQDAAGGEWTLDRDLAGNIIAERSFSGQLASYSYDSAGRLAFATDGAGRRTEFHRDRSGRLRQRRYHDGVEETFEYDARGLLTQAKNPAACVTRQYDAVGRVVAESINDKGTRTNFDALGNRVARSTAFGRTFRMGYDAEGRLVAIGNEAGSLLDIAYDPLGRERLRILSGDVVSESRRTAVGQLLATRTERNGATLVSRSYEYDRAGQLERLDDSTFGTTKFVHDVDGRLVSASYADGGVDEYRFDYAGNVPGVPGGRHELGRAGLSTQVDGCRLQYNGDGRLIEKRDQAAVFRYEYDSAGRLSRLAKEGGETVEFAYDALGRRIRKTSGTRRLNFLWDGDVPLGQFGERCEDGLEFVFLPDGFEPAAVLGKDDFYFLECDHLGTPRSATNRAGELVWQVDYEGFGRVRDELTSIEGIPFRFPGQYADKETGLHYNRVRYYDPRIRTYIAADPIGLAGGTKPYNYVPSPIGWIDPYGQTPTVIATGSRSEAMRQAQEHAQVPRESRGGQPITFDELNAESRGRNFNELQSNGATNLGRRDPATGAEVFDHPDGHPHQVGPEHPPHHAEPHVHAKNAKGEEKIFTYPRSKCP